MATNNSEPGTAVTMSQASPDNLPFLLRLPAEIRLAVYGLLLSSHTDKNLRIRTEDLTNYGKNKLPLLSRHKFRYIVDRMRSRSAESTYCLYRTRDQVFHTSILSVNKQIHSEAADLLYSAYTFDFDLDVECIVPFLQDLTPTALSSLRRIRLVKRSLPYTKDFDRCEWRNACTFIAENMQLGTMRLRQLDLGVLGGTPALVNRPALHWKQRHLYTNQDFELITKLEEMAEDMEWVNHVGAIKGLQALNVKAVLEHCPIPTSQKMAFFINFSASIEHGFADYLKSIMFTPA